MRRGTSKILALVAVETCCALTVPQFTSAVRHATTRKRLSSGLVFTISPPRHRPAIPRTGDRTRHPHSSRTISKYPAPDPLAQRIDPGRPPRKATKKYRRSSTSTLARKFPPNSIRKNALFHSVSRGAPARNQRQFHFILPQSRVSLAAWISMSFLLNLARVSLNHCQQLVKDLRLRRRNFNLVHFFQLTENPDALDRRRSSVLPRLRIFVDLLSFSRNLLHFFLGIAESNSRRDNSIANPL